MDIEVDELLLRDDVASGSSSCTGLASRWIGQSREVLTFVRRRVRNESFRERKQALNQLGGGRRRGCH